MFKATFCFTLFLCYIQCSFSVPTEATTTEKTSIFLRFKDKVKSFFQPVKDWFSNLTKELIQPLKKLGGLSLRMEIAAIAVDEHLAFPKPLLRQEDQLEHKTAKAIVVLWQRLPTMLKMDRILVNVTDTLIGSAIAEADNGTKILFEQIELKLKEDPELYADFAEIKLKLEDDKSNSSDGHFEKKVDDDASKAIEEFLRLPRITRLIYNKRFILASKRDNLVTSDQVEKSCCFLVQAFLKVARKPEFSIKLQNLYDEILDEISKSYDPVEKLADGSVKFLENLGKRLDLDESLKAQIDAAEKDLVASGSCSSESVSALDALMIL